MLTCSIGRPWGLHVHLHNDQACGRCGWIAPGPIGDAREASGTGDPRSMRANDLGWKLLRGGRADDDIGRSIAA